MSRNLEDYPRNLDMVGSNTLCIDFSNNLSIWITLCFDVYCIMNLLITWDHVEGMNSSISGPPLWNGGSWVEHKLWPDHFGLLFITIFLFLCIFFIFDFICVTEHWKIHFNFFNFDYFEHFSLDFSFFHKK